MREELLEKEAEKALQCMPYGYVRRPEDKIVFTDGFKEGYALGLKAKINITTISDAPALPEDEDDYKDSIAKEAWDAVNTCTPYHPESFVQGYIAKAKTIQEASTKCNECGKLCTPSEMTDDRRMCKDCYIKWLEGQQVENSNELERTRRGALLNLDGWRKSDAELTKARGIIQRITEWADWQGTGCPKFADIKSDAEEFLKEDHHIGVIEETHHD